MLGDLAIKGLIAQLRSALAVKDPDERVRVLGALIDSSDAEAVSAQGMLYRARLLAVMAAKQSTPKASLRELGERFNLSKPQTHRLVVAGSLLMATTEVEGWSPPPPPEPKPKRPTINHTACDHERTPKARAACRAARENDDQLRAEAEAAAL